MVLGGMGLSDGLAESMTERPRPVRPARRTRPFGWTALIGLSLGGVVFPIWYAFLTFTDPSFLLALGMPWELYDASRDFHRARSAGLEWSFAFAVAAAGLATCLILAKPAKFAFAWWVRVFIALGGAACFMELVLIANQPDWTNECARAAIWGVVAPVLLCMPLLLRHIVLAFWNVPRIRYIAAPLVTLAFVSVLALTIFGLIFGGCLHSADTTAVGLMLYSILAAPLWGLAAYSAMLVRMWQFSRDAQRFRDSRPLLEATDLRQFVTLWQMSHPRRERRPPSRARAGRRNDPRQRP
jgi:hypothetical protein